MAKIANEIMFVQVIPRSGRFAIPSSRQRTEDVGKPQSREPQRPRRAVSGHLEWDRDDGNRG